MEMFMYDHDPDQDQHDFAQDSGLKLRSSSLLISVIIIKNSIVFSPQIGIFNGVIRDYIYNITIIIIIYYITITDWDLQRCDTGDTKC